MIRSLRWKVVGLNMLLVTAILLAVFAGVYVSSRGNIVRNSDRLLEEALSGGLFAPQRPGAQGGDMPYFVADVMPDGRVRVNGSSYYDLNDEETLLAIINCALTQNADRGVLEEYHLRYRRQADFFGTRIAFVDSSLETSTLRSITGTMLLIGALALLVLFGCSYLLSGLITRPVERSWETQRRFLSDASHELKTPLTVILSSAELLKSAAGDDAAGYVDNICAEGQRMKGLVDSMLTLSRLEQLPRSDMTTLDLSDLATDAVLRFEPVAFEAGHTLADDIAPGLTLRGDAGKLTQAVGVLLDNAIKYAAAGTPIRLTLSGNGKFAVLTVENQGEPVPAEKLAHLFDRFYRADESRSGVEGFGLGLSIAQSIAQRHKGTLRCESDAVSTRFILTLPLNGGGERGHAHA